MKHCDVCGKDLMMDDLKTSLMGALVQVRILKDQSPEYIAFVQRQLGPYETGREYAVCFECLIRSFGIREGT